MSPPESTVEYDRDVMAQQADALYTEAERAPITGMVAFGIVGLLLGALSFDFLADRSEVLAIVVALGIPIGAAVTGGLWGERGAFKLRAQAQQILVLLTIEKNTRERPPAKDSHSS